MNETFRFDELQIVIDGQQRGFIRLLLTGKSNSREPGKVLAPLFDRVLAAAVPAAAKVELHFEKLEHFNSSTIAALVQLINSAQRQKVCLTVHYDGRLKWQALSFDALKRAIQPFVGEGTAVQFLPVGMA